MALWKAGRGAQVSRLGDASEYWKRKWVVRGEKILETQVNSWPSSEFRSSTTTITTIFFVTTTTTPATTTTTQY